MELLMIVDLVEAPEICKQMLRMRQSEQLRLNHIARYMDGKHDPPYAPKGVNSEYRWIMKRGKRNFLPLVVAVISENLHVDGYRPSGKTTVETASSEDPDPSWQAFVFNRMISRQHGIHRAVSKYGAAYIAVLPAEMKPQNNLKPSNVPFTRPMSPRRMTAFYADEVDDEWPQCAIEVRVAGNPARIKDQRIIVTLYDEFARYIMTSQDGGASHSIAQLDLRLAEPGDPFLNGLSPYAEHDMGVCPVVRFLYEVDLDGETDCQGEVEPLIPIQDQINFTTFNEMMAEQYEAFKQRWVTGMAPVDEEGKDKAPFRPGVDRVWAAEDPATRFGEFGSTELAPYSGSREDGIRHMATISQIPPYHLLGQVANLSAEALAAARDGMDRKVEELQAILTDPWRGYFRLSSLATGDKEGWNDLSGEVVWRNTSARAFAATIDGLGKAAQMLGIPVEELWPLIPGATADDVNRWVQAKQAKKAEDVVKDAVAAALQSQPQYTNVKQNVGGGPGGGGAGVSIPVQIPAGTSGKVTGATAAKSENMATGGGGVNVH
jgi:hypothetical protein